MENKIKMSSSRLDWLVCVGTCFSQSSSAPCWVKCHPQAKENSWTEIQAERVWSPFLIIMFFLLRKDVHPTARIIGYINQFQGEYASNRLNYSILPRLEMYINNMLLICFTEEILQTHIAHWWSPDGLRLAYMTINDTLVPKMEVPFFTGAPYPASLDYHYPKASPDQQILQLNEFIVFTMKMQVYSDSFLSAHQWSVQKINKLWAKYFGPLRRSQWFKPVSMTDLEEEVNYDA